MFIKEKKFKAYAKGKVVKDYPNPYVKDVNGERIDIIPNDEVVTFKKMTASDVMYFIGNVSEEVYEGSVKVGCWFPTELVCGVVSGVFSQNTELSRKTGWISTNGQFGSRNDAFLATGVKEAARILKKNGFNVRFE